MIAIAAQAQSAQAAVERHLRRWAMYADDRLKAHHPTRVLWDRARFLRELRADAPELTAGQLVAVVETFEGLLSRATIPPFRAMPALVVPGRVGLLVDRLDVGGVLAVA